MISRRFGKIRFRWMFFLCVFSTLLVNVIVLSPMFPGVASEVFTKFSVDYDSGDGTANSATYIYNVVQKNVLKDSVTCFKLELSIGDGTPIRKTHAPLVGLAKIQIAGDEQWRSEADLRLVHKYVTQTNVPIVGTIHANVYYQNYSNYPGWPYIVGQTWNYRVFTKPDSFLAKSWTDLWSAQVVSNSTVVIVGGTSYTCSEVVHTIISTDASISPGIGVGGTIIEYWITSGILPVPVKVIDKANFFGEEVRVVSDFNMQDIS
jgi:hypothetical protein